jgi:hypothetical protein
MTVFGTEAPDLTDGGDLTIRPANAEQLGYAPAATSPAGGGDSLLDELLGLARTEVSNIQSYPVNFRPGGWVLEFDAVIAEHEIKRYRKASLGTKKRRDPEDADMSVGNAMVLIEKNTAIYKVIDGKRKKVLDSDDNPLLLNSDEFLNAFGKGANAHVAVRKFLGDAETNALGQAVLKEAGWGEDLEPLDPTEA